MEIQQNVDQKVQNIEALKTNEDVLFVKDSGAHLFSQDERVIFYSGRERVTLQANKIVRVRELQEQNDALQRQMLRCEKDLSQVEDPLSIVAEIEHCKVMIARNAGEILNIYTQNEERLNRIKELQGRNLNLQQSISDSKGNFIVEHSIEERTKSAAGFFHAKAHYEKNLSELMDLTQE